MEYRLIKIIIKLLLIASPEQLSEVSMALQVSVTAGWSFWFSSVSMAMCQLG